MFCLFDSVCNFLKKSKLYMRQKPAAVLIFLTLLSLGLKILAYRTNPLLSRDAALYCMMAQKWYHTGSYQEMHQAFPSMFWVPPGFLWCLKSLMTTGLAVQTAGLIFNILCGLLLIPIGYGLAWEIFRNKKIALITAAFFAVLPSINQLSTEIIRDISGLCLTGAALWLALAGIRRKNWILWSLSALLAGINFLFRYESLECIPIIGIILTVLVIKRAFPWKKAVAFSVLWILLFVLAFASCVYGIGTKEISQNYLQRFSHRFSFLKKGQNVISKGEKSK